MPVSPAGLVERFYRDIWNRQDFAVADEILAADLRFRGSLGSEMAGRAAFLDYVRMVHAALDNYTCTILDLVEGDGRAAARMRFEGVHRGDFLGFAPSGRSVHWAGAAFFEMRDARIAGLWVLGDLDALKRQIASP